MTSSTKTTTNPLERTIKDRILAYLRGCGHYATKTHGEAMQERGVLDVLACVEGVFLALEVKRSVHEKPSVIQRYHIDQIRKAGGRAEVVWSVEQVAEIVDAIKRDLAAVALSAFPGGVYDEQYKTSAP